MTTAPRTWVVGEVVSAAELNTEIRDQFSDILAAWTSYTPTWAATGTAVSLGNGTVNGRYKTIGKLCTAMFETVFGSTTTFGSGVYTWSLPAAAANPAGAGANFVWVGGARGHAANWYHGAVAVLKGATTARIFTQGASQEWSPTQPVTWTASNTNYLHGQVTYEIA